MRRAHVPLLYIWPATCPNSVCRAVICASAWLDPEDINCPKGYCDKLKKIILSLTVNEFGTCHRTLSRLIDIQKNNKILDDKKYLRAFLLGLISDISNPDNAEIVGITKLSSEITKISTIRELGNYSVADPFSGGGAISIEARRIGCDTYSNELNQQALLHNKIVLEYIPKFKFELTEHLEKWLDFATNYANKELSKYFPVGADARIPTAFLWARTIRCEGPNCNTIIPLMKSRWISKKGSQVYVEFDLSSKTEHLPLRIVHGKPQEKPSGTTGTGKATCPRCGFITKAQNVKKQLSLVNGGSDSAQMYCVITAIKGQKGRHFRLPTAEDIAAFNLALTEKKEIESKNPSEFPGELLPATMTGVIAPPAYGIKSYKELFNSRQLLVMNCYISSIHSYVKNLNLNDPLKEEAIRAILSLVTNRLADLNSSLCAWQLGTPNTAHAFTRWAIPMVLDYGEINPLSGAGGSPKSIVTRIKSGLEFIIKANHVQCSAFLSRGDAASLAMPDNMVDLLFTDPPYYNAVPYADLSDYFYVWSKRVLTDGNASLFVDDLSEKSRELCELASWDSTRYSDKNKSYFESGMSSAMAESLRILRPDGIGVIVFAHKSTSGWEAQIQALLNAGWRITASWPIDTEMGSRMRAQGSAVLGSSVHLVCRPRNEDATPAGKEDIGDWREVLQELPRRIHEWMPRLAEEGVVGADAIFACLGPALEVYSRYSRVEKASGEAVLLREYLEQVWAAVSREALSMIFQGANTEGFEPDARLTAMWLWTLSTSSGPEVETDGGEDLDSEEDVEPASRKVTGFLLDYDAARKIAQGLGATLDDLPHLVDVGGETATLLPVAERASYLFGKEAIKAPSFMPKVRNKQQALPGFEEVIEEVAGFGLVGGGNAKLGQTVLDRVHQSMLLFGAGRSEAMKAFLVDEGVGQDPRFWRLAQAFSALYPRGTQEKRWVDGVLARKKGLGF